MRILDKANDYIGHPREVDEGYEVSMRRDAYAQGYQDAVNDIKSRVEALRDNYIRQMTVDGRPEKTVMFITGKLEAAIMILEYFNEYGDTEV